MSKNTAALIAGAALAGLFAGSNAARAASADSHAGTAILQLADDKASCNSKDGCKSTHDCKGKNSCKGQGGCKTGDNGCKGKNTCKGKGGCSTKTAHTA